MIGTKRGAGNTGKIRKGKRRGKHAPSEASLDAALAAVRDNQMPEVGAAADLGVRFVPDPHAETCELRPKVVNLRDDPIGQMARRGQLGDATETAARLAAARMWQGYYERVEIGFASGIDPTEPVVDGGRLARNDTDSRLAASAVLNRLRRALGITGDRLVTWILGDKLSLAQVAAKLGKTGSMEQKVIGHRFRECLDTLATELGVSLDPRSGAAGPRRARDSFDDKARFAQNPELYNAVRRAADRA